MQSDSFANLRTLILGTPKDFAEWNILMVAFGDSVTQGLTVNPKMAGEDVYHSVLRRELHREFPERTFSTINAGINGKTTQGALPLLEGNVLRHCPHLVIVSFGLNDSSGGESGLPRFEENLTKIVTQILRSGAAVVLMTPNMMASRDSARVDPNFRHALADLIQRQTSGLLARYAGQVRQVGAATGAPVADVYAEWERRQAQGEDMNAHLANGLNHPDAFGHRLAGEVLSRTILSELRQGPSIPGDASAKGGGHGRRS